MTFFMPAENRKQETGNRIVIAGGGTGGHLFPGIAVAQEFRTLLKAEVTFLTTPKAVTAQILEKYGFPWEALPSRALKGQGLLSRLRALGALPGGILHARSRLKALNPHLVLGMGGHTSGPVGLAAYSLGIPLAIHEQNAIPGVTNRWLARLARKVFMSFPDAQGSFPPERSLWTGNPIRGEFFQAGAQRPATPFTVLIMGGSQGAHRLNMEVLAALPLLTDLKEGLHFLHLTGEADEAEVAAGFAQAGFAAEVAAFTPEVAKWMARAHLVVCRAGASTLAELTAVGRAALLVPYPFAANNHQEFNARFLEDAGAAEMILNKDFTGEVLADKMRYLLAHPDTLTQREERTHQLARPAAARDIVEACRELLGG
jgi:UDP-N-acetylglucosamine--N-acetylmuramyl-(pentapeptide) pyrophosphoryl-undecaprenol N-acetylglucosamine transferase